MSIVIRTVGTTGQMCIDSNVAEQRTKGHHAEQRKVTIRTNMLFSGMQYEDFETDGQSGCRVVIRGGHR